MRNEVAPLTNRIPDDPDGFLKWFERLKEIGPGQGDPLFPWLATSATPEQMRWFLLQEVAGEAGFDAIKQSLNIPVTLDNWQVAGDERFFKIIVSPEFADRLNLRQHTRELMQRLERDLETQLAARGELS